MSSRKTINMVAFSHGKQSTGGAVFQTRRRGWSANPACIPHRQPALSAYVRQLIGSPTALSDGIELPTVGGQQRDKHIVVASKWFLPAVAGFSHSMFPRTIHSTASLERGNEVQTTTEYRLVSYARKGSM